jgi:hypothetical protein
MKRIRSAVLAVLVLIGVSACTPQQIAAAKRHARATASHQVPAGLSNCAEMHSYRVSAGLPAAFDALGWRESNCRNEESVHTSCCWGYLQLNVALHLRDRRLVDRYHNCGVYSRFDVDGNNPGDKYRQMCAAKALFDTVGYSAWSTS